MPLPEPPLPADLPVGVLPLLCVQLFTDPAQPMVIGVAVSMGPPSDVDPDAAAAALQVVADRIGYVLAETWRHELAHRN